MVSSIFCHVPSEAEMSCPSLYSRKRLKSLDSWGFVEDEKVVDVASTMELTIGCLQNLGSPLCVEMSCQSNGERENVSSPRDVGGSSTSDKSTVVCPQASTSDKSIVVYPQASTSDKSIVGYPQAPTSDKSSVVYPQTVLATGWMYVNEQGQMCGPYIKEQLYEGLSTGFLPEELHVYPILNGTISNGVPLKYFNQFPDHVVTGFAYLMVSSSDVNGPTNMYMGVTKDSGGNIVELSTTSPYSISGAEHGTHSLNQQTATTGFAGSAHGTHSLNQQTATAGFAGAAHGTHSLNQQTATAGFAEAVAPSMSSVNEELCWLFEDHEGRKHGPHSLVELYSWYHYGYIVDSVMVS